jgi:hypothetical protein
MLMMKERPVAFRTIEGWGRLVLLEAGAVRECEAHGWSTDRADPHARERALLVARQDPAARCLRKRRSRRFTMCWMRSATPARSARPKNEHSMREGSAPSPGRSPAPPRPCPCPPPAVECFVRNQKRAVADEFGMVDGVLNTEVRRALLFYLLDEMRILTAVRNGDMKAARSAAVWIQDAAQVSAELQKMEIGRNAKASQET